MGILPTLRRTLTRQTKYSCVCNLPVSDAPPLSTAVWHTLKAGRGLRGRGSLLLRQVCWYVQPLKITHSYTDHRETITSGNDRILKYVDANEYQLIPISASVWWSCFAFLNILWVKPSLGLIHSQAHIVQDGPLASLFGVSWSHTYKHTVGLLWTSDKPVSETSTYTGQHNI
jgi:hypothetical protein